MIGGYVLKAVVRFVGTRDGRTHDEQGRGTLHSRADSNPQLSYVAARTQGSQRGSPGRDGEGGAPGPPPPGPLTPGAEGLGWGARKGASSGPARAPHQVDGHDVPQRHDPPDGLGRVLGQVDEPVAEHHVLEGVLLRVGHHDARLVGADGVVDGGRQVAAQEGVQAAVGARGEAGGRGAGHAAWNPRATKPGRRRRGPAPSPAPAPGDRGRGDTPGPGLPPARPPGWGWDGALPSAPALPPPLPFLTDCPEAAVFIRFSATNLNQMKFTDFFVNRQNKPTTLLRPITQISRLLLTSPGGAL